MRTLAPRENSTEQRTPPRGRPFPKGVSGNPHGRPKEFLAFKAWARAQVDDQVFRDKVLAMLTGRSWRERAWAMQFLTEYGIGKPTSHVEGAIDVQNICYVARFESADERREPSPVALRSGQDVNSEQTPSSPRRSGPWRDRADEKER